VQLKRQNPLVASAFVTTSMLLVAAVAAITPSDSIYMELVTKVLVLEAVAIAVLYLTIKTMSFVLIVLPFLTFVIHDDWLNRQVHGDEKADLLRKKRKERLNAWMDYHPVFEFLVFPWLGDPR
jgi:hypothetical protein